MSKCVVCQVPASQACSKCNSTYYCSKVHQKLDWKTHKLNCGAFKIKKNELFGKYLIATRDIQPNEVILKKKPLIVAPKIISPPICLGCHKFLIEKCVCSTCGWPVCDHACSKSSWHLQECQIFAKNNFKPNITGEKQGVYSLIGPLRAILLRGSDKFKTLIEMESHLKENLETPLYKIYKLNLIPTLRSLKLIKNETDASDVLKICSIFDTNAFEIRNNRTNVRALYPLISLLVHDCTPNTKHTFHAGDEMRVVATRLIRNGERISVTYTQTLWSTVSRLSHLRRVKNFDCTCQRCGDPTEFDTYAGALICQKCDAHVLSVNPLNVKSVWKCEKCHLEFSPEHVAEFHANIKTQIRQIDKTRSEDFETFLTSHKGTLPVKSCHFLEVKYALIQLYGILTDASNEVLQRRIQLCEELLEVADVLEPGCSGFHEFLVKHMEDAKSELKFKSLIDSKKKK